MSSKPEAQNEPTMEEILASIRRIISEDEPQGGKPAEAIPPATPPAAPKAAAKPTPEAPARGAENILELTKMVADDGSIVDLAAEGTAADEPAPEELAEEPAAEESAAEDLAGELAEEPAAEAPEGEDEASAEELLTPVPEDETEDEPAEEAAAEEDPGEEEPAEEDPAEDDSAEEDSGEAEAARPAQVPATAGEGSDFVSAATAAAATASLAAVTKAAMANRQGGAVAIGGGRTLEELVRESLAPELKVWLDDNLPDLVERIVREEIRKMVRRAEEQ